MYIKMNKTQQSKPSYLQVAMSKITSTLPKLFDACDTQSDRMSRPSASVLLISTVFPDFIVKISSFLTELGPMAFSTMASMSVIFFGNFNCTAAMKPPNTPALPPLSKERSRDVVIKMRPRVSCGIKRSRIIYVSYISCFMPHIPTFDFRASPPVS